MAKQALDKRALTDASVRAVELPASGRRDIIDATTPGLILRVSATGRKTWLRRANGTRAIIGSYPATTLAEARRACAEMRDAGSDGITIADAAERFIRAHAAQIRSGDQLAWLMRKHVIPRLGARAVASIGRADVASLLRAVQGEDTTKRARIANRVRAALSKMLRWAVSEGLAPSNPAALVEPRRGERRRSRVLSDEELPAIWQACEDWPGPFGDIVKLLILTGQRRDEIAEMTWEEINAGRLDIPAGRMKNKQPHAVPLLPEARHILLLWSRIDGDTPPGPVFGRFSNWSKSKARLDRLSGVTGWQLRDIRHTVMTGMVRLGVPRDIADQVLSHKMKGTGAIYLHGSDLAACRDALERWGEHVEKLVAPRLPGLL